MKCQKSKQSGKVYAQMKNRKKKKLKSQMEEAFLCCLEVKQLGWALVEAKTPAVAHA